MSPTTHETTPTTHPEAAAAPSRRPRRSALLLVVAVLAALVLSACTPQQNEAHTLVNNTRAAHGLRALHMHGTLNNKAQAWAEQLAREGGLRHSNLASGAPAGWRALGENVGVGYSIRQVHDAYMNSPSHRANILGNWTHAGYGVATSRDGRTFTVQVFMRA